MCLAIPTQYTFDVVEMLMLEKYFVQNTIPNVITSSYNIHYVSLVFDYNGVNKMVSDYLSLLLLICCIHEVNVS